MSQKKPGRSYWMAVWIDPSTAKHRCFPLLQPTTLGQLPVTLTIQPSFPSLFQHTGNTCAIFLSLIFLYSLCPPSLVFSLIQLVLWLPILQGSGSCGWQSHYLQNPVYDPPRYNYMLRMRDYGAEKILWNTFRTWQSGFYASGLCYSVSERMASNYRGHSWAKS